MEWSSCTREPAPEDLPRTKLLEELATLGRPQSQSLCSSGESLGFDLCPWMTHRRTESLMSVFAALAEGHTSLLLVSLGGDSSWEHSGMGLMFPMSTGGEWEGAVQCPHGSPTVW